MEVVRNAGIMAIATMFVGIIPLAMGVVYALWPNEQRLSLLRPLSLATVFATIAGFALGLINELRFMVRSGTTTFTPQVMQGLAEGIFTLFFGFGCLTVAWLCVSIGLWRKP